MKHLPSNATIINITTGCKRPLIAIKTPKSVPVSLMMKLFTVMVSPQTKARMAPIAKLILAFVFTHFNSSSDNSVSSTGTFNSKIYSAA